VIAKKGAKGEEKFAAIRDQGVVYRYKDNPKEYRKARKRV